MATQLITPNPNITAEEGMCLQYVRQTFGLPARYGSATEAWNNSPSQHRDREFPQGVDHPVWYGLDSNANGHVVLRMSDGSVYSTSDLAPSPLHHHPSIADLEAYYAYYGVPLTYRGWTEDVAGTPVISLDGTISYEGTITEQEEDMANVTDDQLTRLLNAADRVNGVITDPNAKVLTTNDFGAISNAVLDAKVKLPNGTDDTSLRTKVTFMKQEFNVIGAKVDALIGTVATLASAQPGVTLSEADILKQIDNTLRDVLAKGSESKEG
jgi:hypothetical protein